MPLYEELFNGWGSDAEKEYIVHLTDALGLENVSGIKWTAGEGWYSLRAEAVRFEYSLPGHGYELTAAVEVNVDFCPRIGDEFPVMIDGRKGYMDAEEAAEAIRKAAMAKLEKEAV